MDLKAATLQAAKPIRRGALKAGSMDTQVSSKSWHLLADINAGGMLTFDSQDAPAGAGGGTRERAYVSVFMSKEQAAAFVDTLNVRTDKVAMIVHPCQRFETSGRIPVTVDHGRIFTRFPPYMGMTDHKHLRKQAGLRPGADVAMVECLDARWGRCAWKKGGLFADIVRCL